MATRCYSCKRSSSDDEISSFSKQMLDSLQDGKYSDLEVRCGERVFKVHRSVVCCQSKFFERMADGSFQEAKTGIVELHDDSPDDVARMVKFFYTGTYTGPSEPQTRCSDLGYDTYIELRRVDAAMYALGEKYMIPRLKKLALDTCGRRTIKTEYHLPEKLLRFVYDSTPSSDRGLKDRIIKSHYSWYQSEADIPPGDGLFQVPEAYVDCLKKRLEESWGSKVLEAQRGRIVELEGGEKQSETDKNFLKVVSEFYFKQG